MKTRSIFIFAAIFCAATLSFAKGGHGGGHCSGHGHESSCLHSFPHIGHGGHSSSSNHTSSTKDSTAKK